MEALEAAPADEGGTRVYERVDRPLIPVVAQMERHGIKVDRAALARLSGNSPTRSRASKREIYDCAGSQFTIGSPQQLGDILFDKMGYKGGRKGKSGQYSTDQAILEGLAAQGARVARQGARLAPAVASSRSTYTDALQAAINPETGRVHTSYCAGRRADRAASLDRSQPAEHPDPHRDRPPDPRGVRAPSRATCCSPPTIRRSSCGSPRTWPTCRSCREAFARGEDIHSRTAQEMFGTVDRDTRGRAKTINFAILYGISRWGLAGRLGDRRRTRRRR